MFASQQIVFIFAAANKLGQLLWKASFHFIFLRQSIIFGEVAQLVRASDS